MYCEYDHLQVIIPQVLNSMGTVSSLIRDQWTVHLPSQELDRAATESVRRKLDKIDAALFEGRSTGSARVDDECKEWSGKFLHLE